MRSSRRQFLCLAIVAFAWHDAARGQSPEELRAAEETEFPGLRLVSTRNVDARLSLLGIRLGYVEKDVRLGTTGKYFCGALPIDRNGLCSGDSPVDGKRAAEVLAGGAESHVFLDVAKPDAQQAQLSVHVPGGHQPKAGELGFLRRSKLLGALAPRHIVPHKGDDGEA